ncbi:TetR/AcrR family transcriptional regulator [Nocardioides caeni]|uniref:TetR/AcrR family transcriptional regulator n=1 Tax=Nocardioides caeni TaxID=574700 RepID=A0A4S8N3X1_9ACTN|nr:TetR/AcrR family transcriptional regulator [Nocardioides caeni]THV10773.1 TetR/AcrR family transcriptional regulator [Nocardioides caeni]
MTDENSHRPAGRPRDPRIEAAAFAAVRELLATEGYAAVTMTAVADRAGTTKAALYRRWPSLPHLVHEAAFPDELALDFHLGATLHEDLAQMVRGTRDALSTPIAAAALGGLLPEFTRHPEIHAAVLERFAGVFTVLDERLQQAAAAGQVRSDARAQDLLRLVIGAVLVELLLGPAADGPDVPDGADEDWADRLAATLERGIRT